MLEETCNVQETLFLRNAKNNSRGYHNSKSYSSVRSSLGQSTEIYFSFGTMVSLMKNRAALKTSARSLFLLKEFGSIGEQLELVLSFEFMCTNYLRIPLRVGLSSLMLLLLVNVQQVKYSRQIVGLKMCCFVGKYKRFFVHYRPTSGLWAGGEFSIEFDVRGVPEYPNKPPLAKMRTKIWHPNIDVKFHTFTYISPTLVRRRYLP